MIYEDEIIIEDIDRSYYLGIVEEGEYEDYYLDGLISFECQSAYLTPEEARTLGRVLLDLADKSDEYMEVKDDEYLDGINAGDDVTHITVSKEAWDEFDQMLDSEGKFIPSLANLFRMKKPDIPSEPVDLVTREDLDKAISNLNSKINATLEYAQALLRYVEGSISMKVDKKDDIL